MNQPAASTMLAAGLHNAQQNELFTDLFTHHASSAREPLGGRAWVLRGAALPYVPAMLATVAHITAQAPFRHMQTPGGKSMSVALTNCGALGWTSDSHEYRYTPCDPSNGQPWPAMPPVFAQLAREAAAQAGFAAFCPDACLINRYLPGARLSLHQDRDEKDFSAPIVSVSLGMPAVFLFGGLRRADATVKVPLFHGDVVVWGGEDRLRYHGIAPIKDRPHALLGSQRINFTLRRAG